MKNARPSECLLLPSRQLASRAFTALVAMSVFTGCGSKKVSVAAPPEVFVAAVVQRDVPVFQELVGQTRGSQDVEIRARVEGFLEHVAFNEGSFVRRGDQLYQIDPKPLESALANAKANLATAEARRHKTTTDVARLRPLALEQAVSQQELDNAISAEDAARAQVDANRASAEKAALDLSYCRILSPIDGVVGTTLVKAGNLVGRGESTLLTTVSQVDPIFFRAGISEAEYLRLARRIAEAGGAAPERGAAAIQLLLADGTTHPYPGRLDAIERAVDPTTGTLAIQVSFPNPDRLLRPGQYGRVRFQADLLMGALLVPQRAVQELQNLHTLAVVGSDGKVETRNVEVGPRVDSLWVIAKGLEPGERRRRRGTPARARRPDREPAADSGGLRRRAHRRTGGSEVGHGALLHQPPDRGDGDLHRHGRCSVSWRCRACRSRSTPRSSRRWSR